MTVNSESLRAATLNAGHTFSLKLKLVERVLAAASSEMERSNLHSIFAVLYLQETQQVVVVDV